MSGDFVTKEEFDQLRSEVNELAKSVNTFVDHSSRYIDVLLASVTGQVPEKSITLDSHNRIIRYIITAFSIITAMAIGAAETIPHFLHR
jgi:hypothetical protein